MTIPGLYAGGNVDICYRSPGLVALIQTDRSEVNNKTSKQRSFEWYCENILLPFITECRTSVHVMDPD